MKAVVGLSALAISLLAGCSSVPGGEPKPADEHAAHHPADKPAGAAGYDQQMSAMHEMHQKMASAKTPDERAALMKDHMKTLHDGMGMMGRMHGGMMGGQGAMPMDADMMKRRMDMMEMMMQLMVDREGMRPPAER